MTVFVDTSALFPAIDRADDDHRRTARTAVRLLENERLVTHNYVVVELLSLVQRRVGMSSVRRVIDEFLPSIETLWVDQDLHSVATAAFVASGRRRTSLVDFVSFEVMRREGITTAFAIDRDFVTEGFRTIS